MDIHSNEKISREELADLFGDTIPMDAVAVLTDSTMTIIGVRHRLVEIAAEQKPLAIAREIIAALSDGWGEEEDRRCVAEIMPIIMRHMSKH